MIDREDQLVHMIPVDQITVLNPRLRGNHKFKQIVDNIAKLGLKRPITVARNDDDSVETDYVLVCGQGRLEAFMALGETNIPAFVINGQKEASLLMSLVENLARRQHSAVELVKEIRILSDRDYSFSQIAEKTDLAKSYVQGILKLLKKGEDRLVRAVETGQIPLTIAMTISRSDDKAIQKALADAYESNDLRGKQLLSARRLIEKRRLNGKSGHTQAAKVEKKVSTDDLLRTYQQETLRQRMVIQKAKICETRLLFAVSALKQLLGDDNFVNVLRAESLDTLPQYLSTQTGEPGERE
ncbi:MAG: plasmid partitioning protein RepB C-terminal domain-containing protein [Fuerstiella sp.]